MKFTEILVCMIIFLLASAIFLETLVIIRKDSSSVIIKTETAKKIITADSFLRKSITDRKIPYWNNLTNECFEIEEQLEQSSDSIGIKILSVHPIHDEQTNLEGICIEWNNGHKNYITKQYIRQRILDE